MEICGKDLCVTMHAATLVGKVASYVSKTEVLYKLLGNGALATSRGTHDNAVQHLSLHLYTINGLIDQSQVASGRNVRLNFKPSNCIV